MKKLAFGNPLLYTGLAAALSLGACVSGQNHSTIEAIEGASKTQPHPFVEGFIEYGGPQAKWSGPSSFMIHVLAKDAGPAQISVTPELYNEVAPAGLTMGGRVPASEGMSSDSAREHLGLLGVAIQNGGEQDFRGCLSPVRVRLIRSDGSLVEKQGCRSHTGWPRATSEMVNNLITAKAYGVSNKAPVMSVPAPTAPQAAAGHDDVVPAVTAKLVPTQSADHGHGGGTAAALVPAQASAPVAAQASVPSKDPHAAVVPAAVPEGHGYVPTGTTATDSHEQGGEHGNRAPAGHGNVHSGNGAEKPANHGVESSHAPAHEPAHAPAAQSSAPSHH